MIVAPHYLSFIENEKISKDKDTNFIPTILLSDRQLKKTKAMKPVKRKKCMKYQVHQTKDFEVLKCKENFVSLNKRH